jgi:hypothetical protein
MRIEKFGIADQIEINVKTASAVKALTEECEDGRFDDTLDVLAFLAGYCKGEPVLIEDIFKAIRSLHHREILAR